MNIIKKVNCLCFAITSISSSFFLLLSYSCTHRHAIFPKEKKLYELTAE